MSDSPSPPAGWYDDPDRNDEQRFWDGQKWTDDRRPKLAPTPATPPPAPQYVVAAADNNGYATAALVLGILALVLVWIPGVNFVLAVLALIFGILGRNKIKRGETAAGQGMAISGIVMGSVSLAIVVLFLVSIIGITLAGSEIETTFSDISNQLEP